MIAALQAALIVGLGSLLTALIALAVANEVVKAERRKHPPED
jgi:hypothetical protein